MREFDSLTMVVRTRVVDHGHLCLNMVSGTMYLIYITYFQTATMLPFRELYPLVVADVALFSVNEQELRVLLVQRSQAPEMHRWALPGGLLQPEVDVSLEDTARRVLRQKVSVDIPYLEEVCTFSGTSRDPRGWSIGVLFYALLPRDQVNALVKDKVEALAWIAADHPEQPLAFDHALQLSTALKALRDKVERHALPLHLLPERFTLAELQRTCEAILGRPLDKSVFRRRLKGTTDLIPVDEFVRGAQRPAQLFRARDDFVF